MAVFKSINKKLKSDVNVIVRSAEATDSEKILTLARTVIEEDIFSLTSGPEFKMNTESHLKWVESHKQNPNHIALIAECDNEIIGILDFSNGPKNRISHTGEFGISIDKDYRNQGVGTILIQTLFDWVNQHNKIEKVCLSVHANNDRAIALYKKMGFEIEGIRKKDLKYADNTYIDTIIMGKILK